MNHLPLVGAYEPHETTASAPPEESITDRRTFLGRSLTLALAAPVLAACDSISNSAPPSSPENTPRSSEAYPSSAHEGLSDSRTKRRAESIISSFENSTTKIQYDYAENIEDGRGITAGRAGFTSGTSDLLMVVEQYLADTKSPDANPLRKYLKPLRQIEVDGTDPTKGLGGFVDAWERTSKDDPTLNEAQDKVYDRLYFDPAMARAAQVGVESAVGQLIILDTIIQHGEGEDADGLPAIIDEAVEKAGNAKDNEAAWLSTFLKIRKYHLEHAADPETAQAWKDSVSRVDALRFILKSDNPDLKPPLEWQVYGDHFTLEV